MQFKLLICYRQKHHQKKKLPALYALQATLAAGPTVQSSYLCLLPLFPTCPPSALSTQPDTLSPNLALETPHLLLVRGRDEVAWKKQVKAGT